MVLWFSRGIFQSQIQMLQYWVSDTVSPQCWDVPFSVLHPRCVPFSVSWSIFWVTSGYEERKRRSSGWELQEKKGNARRGLLSLRRAKRHFWDLLCNILGQSAMFPCSFSMTICKRLFPFCKGKHGVWTGRQFGQNFRDGDRVGSQGCLTLKPLSFLLSSSVGEEDRRKGENYF